jgi:hypothetical protein
MADTYYAWNNFPTDFNEYGQPTKTIKVGDTVSQSDLGVSDEEWQDLADSGAVRTDEYPDIPNDIAPAEWYAQHPEDNPALPQEVRDAAALQVEAEAMVAPPDDAAPPAEEKKSSTPPSTASTSAEKK